MFSQNYPFLLLFIKLIQTREKFPKINQLIGKNLQQNKLQENDKRKMKQNRKLVQTIN